MALVRASIVVTPLASTVRLFSPSESTTLPSIAATLASERAVL